MHKDTTKDKRLYRILTPSDREEIMIGLRKRESIRTIAKNINRNPSVVSREIKNNITEDNKYQCYWAQKRSERRRKVSRLRERISDYEIRSYLEEKLKQEWSPEQIAGRIKLDLGKAVSYETIYQYIFKIDRSLVKHLLCGRKHRRKRIHKRNKRVMIPNRTGIEERSEAINNREEVGHWEADTAVSRQSKTAIMVLQSVRSE
jgi:IS30 family transposase